MSLENLTKLGNEIGVKDEADGVQRRERKEKNAKKMTKKELESELPKVRKDRNRLQSELEEMKKGNGLSSDPGPLTLPPEMWGAIPAVLYEYLAIRFGGHWRLSREEIPIIGVHFEAVLNRYLPDMSTNHPELLGFGLIVVGLTLPRAMKTVQNLREVRKKTAKTEPDAKE